MEPRLALAADGLARVRESVAALLGGAAAAGPDGAQALLARPEGRGNSQAWLVWHLTRVLDEQGIGALAPLVPGFPGQLWIEEGFAERFALPYPPRDHGYGHTAEQVAAFPAVDPAELAAYHEAVQNRLLALLEALGEDGTDAVVDAAWDPPVTAGVRLVSVLDDAARHIGQAEYVRGLVLGG